MYLTLFFCVFCFSVTPGVKIDIPIPNTHKDEELATITEDFTEYSNFLYISNIHIPYDSCVDIYSTVFLFFCKTSLSYPEKNLEDIQVKCPYFISACQEDTPQCLDSPFKNAPFLLVISQKRDTTDTTYVSSVITIQLDDVLPSECLVYGSLALYWLPKNDKVISLNISEPNTGHYFQPLSILSLGPIKCHMLSLFFFRGKSLMDDVDVKELHVSKEMVYYEIDTEDEEVTSMLLRCQMLEHTSASGDTLFMVSGLSLNASIVLTPKRISPSYMPFNSQNPVICHEHKNDVTIVNVDDEMLMLGVATTNHNFYLMGCLNGANIHHDSLYPCSNSFIPIAVNKSISYEDATLPLGPATEVNKLILQSSSREDYCLTLLLAQSNTTTKSLRVLTFAAANAVIPSHTKSFFLDMSCEYDGVGDVPLSYRAHMHRHGVSVTLWVVQRNVWKLLVEDTELSGGIVPLSTNVTLSDGDVVNVRCQYDTSEATQKLTIGPDLLREEMCNLYLFVSTSTTMKSFFCSNANKLNPPEQILDDRGEPSKIYYVDKSWNLYRYTSNQSIRNIALFNDSTLLLIIGVEDKNNPNLFLTLDLKTDTITFLPTGTDRLELQGLFATPTHRTFVTDIGLQRVFRFRQISDSEPSLVLTGGKNKFCQPSSVVVDRNDVIYVGDGLCGSRVVKFSKEGQYLDEYGQVGTRKGVPGAFKEVTDMAYDSLRDIIYLADSALQQLHIMDSNGNFIEVHGFSTYESIVQVHYCPHDFNLYMVAVSKLNGVMLRVNGVAGTVKVITTSQKLLNVMSMACLAHGEFIIGTTSGHLVRIAPQNTNDLRSSTEIVPQIHYLNVHPNYDDETFRGKESAKSLHLREKVLFGICVLVLLSGIPLAVMVYRFLRRKMVNRIRYQRIAREISDDEESVIYDNYRETGDL